MYMSVDCLEGTVMPITKYGRIERMHTGDNVTLWQLGAVASDKCILMPDYFVL